jgi:hypothetical protein
VATTKAYHSWGDVDISVTGKTWEIPEALKPALVRAG